MTDTITIPAYAADTLNETMTLHCPTDWHPRVRALSPRCCYGPEFHRGVRDALASMSEKCARGFTGVAYDDLLTAERFAGVAVPSGEAQ